MWSTNRPLARVLAWVALRVASSAGKGFCDELLVRGDVVTVICKSNTGRHAVDVRGWSVGVPDHLRWLTLPYAPCAVRHHVLECCTRVQSVGGGGGGWLTVLLQPVAVLWEYGIP